MIITGDDFGLAEPVNEAIELAHREGVLSTASLLIGEAGAADAVARARRNPTLRVGLHFAVCDGRPSLPPAQVATLVNARGELYHPMVAVLRLFFLGRLPVYRRQLEAEMRAQFEAFRRTGLSFDHVNGHNNMQLHPVVLPILIQLCREYGVNAVRVPCEPLLPSWRAARSRFLARFFVWLVMWPWAACVKRRLRRSGFVVNDYLFGIVDCGSMERALLRRIIECLPDGVSEIHCHPATRRCPALDKTMSNYGHEAELQALVDPEIRSALSALGTTAISGYGGLRARRESTR